MPSDHQTSMPWPRVLGQRRVKLLLQNAMRTARLPHAYLFHGPEGVGKDAMAIEFARVLQCENGGVEACGKCDSCAKMATLQHPDVHLITALPVGKNEEGGDGPFDRLTQEEMKAVRSEFLAKAQDPYHRIGIPRATGIKVNSIREIRREAPLASAGNRRRIFILSNADMLADVAANTLLKTLEEPPAHCMFILTTSYREELLPTILSRCQQVRFDPLSDAQIQDALMSRDGVEANHAALLARLSGGSYSRARELTGDDLMGEREHVLEFVRRTVAGHHADVGKIIDTVTDEKDRTRVTRFLHLLLLWFRDALVLGKQGSIINIDQREPLERFIGRYPAADIPVILADIDRAISLVERNVYIKLILYNLAGQMKANIR
ncbi:MAG: DNA polymerase III subunit delta' [Ignavibacteriae bacterium]|nr:DNA polymerase III subunit delta' [Ignavibacteriota bacterium]